MTAPTTFDIAAMMERLQEDEEHSRELLLLFLQYQTTMLGDIANAVKQQDAAAIEFSAHRAKGAVASIHADSTRQLIERIEDAAVAGDCEAAAGLMLELEPVWAALIRDLNEYTSALSPQG